MTSSSSSSTESSSLITLPMPKCLQPRNLTQQCKDLLPTLPSDLSLIGGHYYLYRGFWLIAPALNGLLSCHNNFLPREDDIILSTFPKSGTTWLKAILFALSKRSTGEHSSRQHSPLLTKNPHDLVPFLEVDLFADNEDPDLTSFTSPRVFATHLPHTLLPRTIMESKCKVVYLTRNVKDNLASLWHFTNKHKRKERGENTLEEIFDRFCRGRILCGPYWDHALGYWKASLEMPDKVFFLKYEDMKERPVEIVKSLAKFIGCPFDPNEDEDEAANEILQMCSFQSLSKLEVNKNGKTLGGFENKMFFRKGEVGDWKNLLSSEMADKLDSITKEKLSGSGLKL